MKNPTYQEFMDESKRILANAVITGGLNEMGIKFQYSIMNWHHTIMQSGGFTKDKDSK